MIYDESLFRQRHNLLLCDEDGRIILSCGKSLRASSPMLTTKYSVGSNSSLLQLEMAARASRKGTAI